jgi:PAS domain-containing protein
MRTRSGFTIRGDWAAPGSKSIVGHYSLADFGRLAVENLSAGLPLVVNDNLKELAPDEAATFRNIGIAATICMPLVKAGRLTALMAIHDRVPRVWTESELNLLREVTARSWAHVERVGVAAELRATEERLRLAVDNAEVGFWDVDLVNDVLIWPTRTKAMFGISADVPVTMQDFYDGLHPKDRAATSEAFAATADPTRRALYDVEYRTVGKEDGIIRWVAAKGRGVFDEAGCSCGSPAPQSTSVNARRPRQRCARARRGCGS